MSETFSGVSGGDADVVAAALVASVEDVFDANFIYDHNTRLKVARMLLDSGSLVDYLGHKYDFVQHALGNGTSGTTDPYHIQKTQVNVAVGLTPTEKADISAANPDVEVRFLESPSMPHGKANALRVIHRNQALALVSHHSGTVLDIGGNYLQAALGASNRSYQLHCCTKLEGELEYHRQVQRDVAMHVSMLEADYCTDGAENCDVHAPHGICIHALTMIDPALWPRIFRMHGLEYVLCFFHYDVAIEVDDVGFMPAADMHWNRKGEFIECHFENDSSHPYVHRRDWMIKYGHSWTMTEDDWEYVLYYQIEYVKDGVAKASFTRLEKSTIGPQESICQFRYIDIDDGVELEVPKYDPTRGLPVTDPFAYRMDHVRVNMPLFSYVMKMGISNQTSRPDLPLSLDDVKVACHSFNHMRRVNGTSITVPYKLGASMIDEVALGLYLVIVRRAAVSRVKFAAYIDSMRRLQRSWGDEGLLKLLAKFTSSVALAPFAMLAESAMQAMDMYVVHMRQVTAESLVTVHAADIMPYRHLTPIRSVAGTAEKEMQSTFPGYNDVACLPETVSPEKFYDVFRDTLTEQQRTRLEEYIKKLPAGNTVSTEVEHDEPPEESEEFTREQWHTEYDELQDLLGEKDLPPLVDKFYTFEQRTNHDKVWEYAKERIHEYMMYNYDVSLHAIGHAMDQCRDTWGGDKPNKSRVHALNVQTDAEISYFMCEDGVISGMDVNERWALVIDPVTMRHYPTFQKSGKVMLANTHARYVFSSQAIKIFNGFAIATRARKMLTAKYVPKASATLMDGVPGCGKTYRILQEFTVNDVIITTVKDTQEATLRELLSDPRFAGMEGVLKDRVRTLDSANKHGLPRARTLFVDEGLMAHSGGITMAVVDARPKKLCVYGDSTQIRFIDRGSRIGNLHFQSLFYWTQISEVNETIRCPADAIWVSSQFYPEERRSRIKTLSPVMRSITFVYEPDAKGPVWTTVQEPWVVVSILRADGADLVSRDPTHFSFGDSRGKSGSAAVAFDDGRTVKVYAVHAVQGRTKPLVRVVRISPFNPDVLNSDEHANVCFTRHTLRMEYVGSKDTTDDRCARLARQASLLTNDELREMMLPSPQWLQDRITEDQKRYAKFL